MKYIKHLDENFSVKESVRRYLKMHLKHTEGKAPDANKAIKDLEKAGSEIDYLADADARAKKIWKKAGVNTDDENTIILYSYAQNSWPETKKILKNYNIDYKELPDIDGESFIVFVKESVELNEAVVNNKVYVKAGKLGYNDQFLGRRSLAWTLAVELGLQASDEFVGPWLGFDHKSMYAIGKKGGTILDDALTNKYTYEELKKAAADFLGIK